MKQILCVVDFSESSVPVLNVAVRIATACAAHLIVLFPYRLIDPGHKGDIPSLKLKLESDARQKFDQLSATCGAESVSCEFLPEIGFPIDRLRAHVRRNKVDLIVISQSDAAESRGSITSSTADMIATLNLPFVIVPAPVPAEAQA